jgi:hypothetical protein
MSLNTLRTLLRTHTKKDSSNTPTPNLSRTKLLVERMQHCSIAAVGRAKTDLSLTRTTACNLLCAWRLYIYCTAHAAV